jgi:hypothetical protein
VEDGATVLEQLAETLTAQYDEASRGDVSIRRLYLG